jgi:hypothetical protein
MIIEGNQPTGYANVKAETYGIRALNSLFVG